MTFCHINPSPNPNPNIKIHSALKENNQNHSVDPLMIHVRKRQLMGGPLVRTITTPVIR